ncbi:hypothetical protein [Allorhodopirellula heiligendammensis]|mgnify:CR=1 FL=1|uniref:Uncharacterized protein n=1 Tax=Allorhodopirellula heiligendammensis TaxID=2714739 RepID=A0A5C6C273_9BACT|nr:hypothetical protein [Allorhodopirellula heiligendammensis]TWU18185.1 hypothetical protein Poly21_03400 [Allorhodopirellula heiligendammensis]|tara:strand:- start:538 stop:792 length:255 start_codon:yes stop_codon:yes gene_type:complete
MKPLPLGPLLDSQTRIRHDFLDFAEQWQRTRAGWRDEPARNFEQESLSNLSPTLTRVAAAMQDFADAARRADHLLADPDHPGHL